MAQERIPVIDLFAGPGGLGEGFASARTPSGAQSFDVRLSIEKDESAHRTLELRSFVRSFSCKPPDAYYDYVAGHLSREALFSLRALREQAAHARHEAVRLTLGPESHRKSSNLVREALAGADLWVLVGGPPCQAYSLAGRSRMRPIDPSRFEKDERHFLYREYLRILADHEPPVFIMENVRGILSSTVKGRRIFDQILEDLSQPNGGSLRYKIVPLSLPTDLSASTPNDYVVRCEQHGVPQARHRVILCGVREDIQGRPPYLIPCAYRATIEDAISDLPRIRSRISREDDSHDAWLAILREACSRFESRTDARLQDVAKIMRSSLKSATAIESAGGAFMGYVGSANRLSDAGRGLRTWYRDPDLPGVTGHESRSHMRKDLQRYFFAAAFAGAHGNVSPTIDDFPRYLWPDHFNVRSDVVHKPFADRFRVQVYGRPSTTIVSHISKDGHYYIHPDPAQCRSLTLREAARLQTFPDNYHFEGTRTAQLHQVGNAVPPILAQQIASAVWNLIGQPASHAERAVSRSSCGR